MATQKQRAAARSNVKKAQSGAQKKQTLKNLDKSTQKALGQEAAAVRRGDSPTPQGARGGGAQARHRGALEARQGRAQARGRPRALSTVAALGSAAVDPLTAR